MDIAIIGTGYVGLVAGACFADTGNDVVCVDVDEKKVRALKKGEIPIYEPGLADIVQRNVKDGRLSFTTSLKDGVQKAEIIFIAVGTPQDEDGSADLSHVLSVAGGIGEHMNGYKVIVDKSTVPVGTAEKVRKEISSKTTHSFDVVSNPEFLKEGAAIEDFLKPDRVIIGVSSEKAAKVMKELYAPFVRTNNPIILMDVPSAEMTKYAANTMLATRISFMNEIANLCEKVGADIDSVRIGIGTDSRIGMSFLFPGIGYGGSCFPKDVQALIRTGKDVGLSLKISTAVEEVNARQKSLMFEKISKFYGSASKVRGKRFAIWGLSFKPKTDDVRDAPALVIVGDLIKAGATVAAFDPEAMKTFGAKFGSNASLAYAESAMQALQDADALVICTEWGEFRRPNFKKMKAAMRGAVVFDGRNILDAKKMADEGFYYECMGRPAVTVAPSNVVSGRAPKIRAA